MQLVAVIALTTHVPVITQQIQRLACVGSLKLMLHRDLPSTA